MNQILLCCLSFAEHACEPVDVKYATVFVFGKCQKKNRVAPLFSKPKQKRKVVLKRGRRVEGRTLDLRNLSSTDFAESMV